MAECVSCGGDIPAGKLFCDDCYKKLKGSKGTPVGLAQPPQGKPLEEERGGDEPGAVEGAAKPATVPGVEKRIATTLTPTANKKVVSIKPGLDKTSSEKDKPGKKRFALTITFSDRTYAALARLRRKGKPGGPAESGEAGQGQLPAARPGRRTRKKAGPHGRAQLKAVGGTSGVGRGKRGSLRRAVEYRGHPNDARDIAATFMATVAMILIIVMSFMGWIRLNWTESTGAPRTLDIKGIDLGPAVYVMTILVFLAWLYSIMTWLFKKPILNLDFGVVLIVVGLLFIIIIFVITSARGPVLHAANKALEAEEAGFQQLAAGYGRQYIWPAFVELIMGLLFSLAGLIRLSQR